MIFQHTLDKVLDGSKTQTRRVVKKGECIMYDDDEGRYEWVLTANDRVKWQVDKTYAVQPSRNEKGVARIRITGLRKQNVAHISRDEAVAEGFDNKHDFFATWLKMHPALDMDAWVIEFELVQ